MPTIQDVINTIIDVLKYDVKVSPESIAKLEALQEQSVTAQRFKTIGDPVQPTDEPTDASA